MFEKGLFNGLFDLNGDGKLNNMERALDFAAFMEMVESDEDGESDEDNDF